MTNENFIKKVVVELLDDDIIVCLSKGGDITGGSFDGEQQFLEVSSDEKNWMGVLVHEYCHYRQWKENKLFFDENVNGHFIIDEWLQNKFHKKAVLDDAIQKIITLEWDCEKRAIAMIKKYKLDIDLEQYIKGSNTYLFFYYVVRDLRKWCEETKFLYQKTMLKTMPSKFYDLDYYLDRNNLDEKQYKKYLKAFDVK